MDVKHPSNDAPSKMPYAVILDGGGSMRVADCRKSTGLHAFCKC